MPKLSQTLIQSHYKNWKKPMIILTFGCMMNKIYNLNDKNLSDETDEKYCIINIVKRSCIQKNIIWYSKSRGYN